MSNFVRSLCLIVFLSPIQHLIMYAALKLFKRTRFPFEFLFNINEMVIQLLYNQ